MVKLPLSLIKTELESLDRNLGVGSTYTVSESEIIRNMDGLRVTNTTSARLLTLDDFSEKVLHPLVRAPIGVRDIKAKSGLLDQRGATHGDYRAMSIRIQQIKTIMRMGSKWIDMSEPQKEALELIATKIGRIIEGDPEYLDHWRDGAGYFTKGSEFCRNKEPPC